MQLFASEDGSHPLHLDRNRNSIKGSTSDPGLEWLQMMIKDH